MKSRQYFSGATCAFVLLLIALLSPQIGLSQTDLVTMCFRGRTIQVPSYLVSRYTANGATIGPCTPPPQFTTQPQSQTVFFGNNVFFSSASSANPAPTYQWRFNGTNINGATSANYGIGNVQTNHAGNYTVVASNNSGSATSMVATLTVLTSSVTSLTVTTTNNSGPGSLRQALLQSESALAPAISFAANVTNAIVLSSGELVVNKSVIILGPGATTLAISGNNTSRVFNVLGGNVTISGLTIRDGRVIGSAAAPEMDGAKQRGGGIMNQATLILNGCVVSNNTVKAGRGGDGPNFAGGGGNGSGGGLGNIGTLTATDCSFLNNSAIGGDGGSDPGGNNGMGGQGYGGGVYNLGAAIFDRCLFSGNQATSGIGPGGTGGGSGGGLYNEQDLTLLTCTVAGNAADGSPFDFGGGIFDNGNFLFLRHCTVANNQADYGGGLYALSANLDNTILAGNSAPGNGPDCSGTFYSGDYNLIQNTNGCTIAGAITNNIIGQNPLLGALQNNGGPTLTMNLLAGSPAIDKGKSFDVSMDQRGFGRPWDFAATANANGGDGADIGAYEIQPASPLLNIQRATTNFVLSWPLDAAGFRLQFVTNLPASNNWTPINSLRATNGSQLFVTNAITNGNRFYRLIFP
ncbi:MAG: immunoglobulin domain-containing protein [Verrucomicrobiota bacterium]